MCAHARQAAKSRCAGAHVLQVSSLQSRCSELTEAAEQKDAEVTSLTEENGELKRTIANLEAELAVVREQLQGATSVADLESAEPTPRLDEHAALSPITLPSDGEDSDVEELVDSPDTGGDAKSPALSLGAQSPTSGSKPSSPTRIQSNKSMMGSLGGSYHGEIRLKAKGVELVPIPIDGIVSLEWTVSVASEHVLFRVCQQYKDEETGEDRTIVLLTPRQVHRDKGVLDVERAGRLSMVFSFIVTRRSQQVHRLCDRDCVFGVQQCKFEHFSPEPNSHIRSESQRRRRGLRRTI